VLLLILTAALALALAGRSSDGISRICFFELDVDRQWLQLHQLAERQIILIFEVAGSLRLALDFR